ncbi:hypothetical protein [Ktedonobacter racemifer]|uniref:Uncharacterized protein n=1 Tax=Ktedonobacter racemifer DSM 44963 TaxID=485913 RepID=D6U8Z6_KTERA|nr:hypothetical protein [Ktedonobacter racemifer]EFH79551.1 hypothetical protein Krac_0061 [Ktedonobacter racemifer DSM 44963]
MRSGFISLETLQGINQQALAALLSARLEREHQARQAGQVTPLLDRVEAVSLVDANAAAFIAECDALGIESQADTEQRASSASYRQFLESVVDDAEYTAYIEHRRAPSASEY